METQISTTNMSTEQWHDHRSKGIGGSDVAAILGLSKYKTPLDVYNDKLGLVPPFTGNKYTEAGLMLEDTIANWYQKETGYKVIKDNKIRFHKEHPFLLANLDRIILPIDETNGRGVLEIKTANTYAAKNWETEPPIEYVMQLQHYLDVTGHTWGEFAVLIGGNDFRRYFQQRDDELIGMKNELLAKFWHEHVEKRVPPEPIRSEDIEKLYGRVAVGKTIEAADLTVKTIDELRTIKERIKLLEAKELDLTERLKLAMLDAEAIASQGEILATWKQSKDSETFDSKRFKEDNPDLFNQYAIQRAGSRRFILK